MNNDLDMAYVEKLFDAYIKTLCQEVHSSQQAEKIIQDCISIAETMRELGFQIYATFPVPMIGNILHPDGAEQTVIINLYDIALFKDEVPLKQPILLALNKETKIFGPRTVSIFKKQEEWLRSSINEIFKNQSL